MMGNSVGAWNAQKAGSIVQAGFHPGAVGSPFRQGTDDPQGFRDVQKFAQRQAGARLGAAQSVGHVFDLAEGRRTELGHQTIGGVSFLHQPLHLGQVGHRGQLPCQDRRVRAGGLRRQQLQDLIQLQGLMVAIHKFLHEGRKIRPLQQSSIQ